MSGTLWRPWRGWAGRAQGSRPGPEGAVRRGATASGSPGPVDSSPRPGGQPQPASPVRARARVVAWVNTQRCLGPGKGAWLRRGLETCVKSSSHQMRLTVSNQWLLSTGATARGAGLGRISPPGSQTCLFPHRPGAQTDECTFRFWRLRSGGPSHDSWSARTQPILLSYDYTGQSSPWAKGEAPCSSSTASNKRVGRAPDTPAPA